ncbi:MAG TPA: lipopolysaccharide biosynthesis protein [Candidatus Kapabacteria bacterium]|nr:lipopolysaccharide biosynthesis protein [Candidatus Kapabacteria bacterium]
MSASNRIKSEAISGLLWNFIENGGNYLLNFLIGLVLIRIIDAQIFGIVGMMYFYILLGNILASFSLSNYLIQKPEIDKNDYSTAFWINLLLSLLIYLLIYVFSDNIANFYKESSIAYYIKFFALNVIFSGISVVQIADLSKKMNFKVLAQINLAALLLSGIIAIILSLLNLGLLSLILFQLTNSFIVMILLWIINKWDYGFNFSFSSLRKIGRFSSSIHLVNSLNTLYTEIYNLIIGRLFDARNLAYYLRGRHTAEVLPIQFSNSLLKVLLPVMSSLQLDKSGLKKTYHKVLLLTGLINIPILTFLAANGKSIFILLYTEKWLSAVIYYQLFCIEGMLLPLHLIGANLLIAKGKSNHFMRLELSKRLLQTFIIYFTISSIEYMVIGLIILSIIYTLITFIIVKQECDYKFFEQVKYLLPYLFISALIYMINAINNSLMIDYGTLMTLILNFIVSLIMYIGILTFFRMEAYYYIKEVLVEIIKK